MQAQEVPAKGMTHSTANATPPKSSKLRESNSVANNSNDTKFESEFVPRDSKESEFLNLVDFGEVVISVETVITFSKVLWRKVTFLKSQSTTPLTLQNHYKTEF